MDFTHIFREQAEKKRVADDQAARTAEEEQTRVALNERVMGERFDEVITPILHQAASDLATNGYNGRVEAISGVLGRPTRGIQLAHRPGIGIARISYVGDPATMEITMETYGTESFSGIKAKEVLTINQCVKDRVFEDTSRFIRGILHL